MWPFVWSGVLSELEPNIFPILSIEMPRLCLPREDTEPEDDPVACCA